ncbi:FKBP-type peptidyl-prolyl cis-trans isomerase [Sanyastnella coralliicola]|uniref:FKBP-type peptidyl-prolyl cis-trans isomerase n=1 Tax=Sanyastnella coralliicola TaxID=3069118 RepID=UPI0027B8D249|nr:peptidylprolyl isomerase [Longitalea sp. SCSIO 12813]
MKVKNNDTIRVHYKGTLTNGDLFDSSEGREPLEFTVGSGQVIPGFDSAVIDMEVGEAKAFLIPCDDAYGQADERLVQEVGRDQLPEDMQPEVGMMLSSQLPNGQQIPVKVVEVTDASIKIDANHPLAGEDLNFEITLVEIV